MNLENSQEYYGKVLGGSGDLLTDACSTGEAPPAEIRAALARVHPDVRARYYGCGLVVPQAIEGCRILDLGSGSGQDAFVLAQLVGEGGSVVGVDATPEQLAVARGCVDWQRETFGFARSNVEFFEGDIESHFYIIESGQVSIFTKSKQGLRIEIAKLKDGETFGEFALIDKAARSASAQAITAVKLMKVSAEGYELMLGELPLWASSMLKSFTLRLKQMNTAVKQQKK